MTTTEYNKCVDEYSDAVYRFILKNLKDDEKAKDVVQDSFIKMWDKVKDISFEKSRSYLFSTAYHTMIDLIRREKSFKQYETNVDFSTTIEHQYTDIKEVLENAFQQLPDIQKSVILLRDYEGYSYEEIGKITGLNESQVKVYIYRARLTLKNYIGNPEIVL